MHHDDGIVGHVGHDDGARAYFHVVADAHGPDDFGAGAYKDVITEDGRATPPLIFVTKLEPMVTCYMMVQPRPMTHVVERKTPVGSCGKRTGPPMAAPRGSTEPWNTQ